MGYPGEDGRYYGVRYAESASDSLYVIAGRILSDLKVDQKEDRMPPSAVIIVAVDGDRINVQVHVQRDEEFETYGAESIRARVNTVCQRYNWTGVANRSDVRYRASCSVRPVRGRLDASTLGSLIG